MVVIPRFFANCNRTAFLKMLSAKAARILAMDDKIVPEATLKEVPDWFYCHICRMIMLHVYQLACGHLICAGCKEKLEKDGFLVCQNNPNCTKADLSPLSKIFEDRFQGRAIQNFSTDCLYAPMGCSWFGGFLEYSIHYQECSLRPEKEVEVHEVLFGAPHEVKLKSTRPHSPKEKGLEELAVKKAVDSFVSCPHCQKSHMLEKELQNHIKFECEKVELYCPFTEVGCPEIQGQRREGLENHAAIATEVHLELLLRDHMSLQRTCTEEFRVLFELNKKSIRFEEHQRDLKDVSNCVTGVSKEFETRYNELDMKMSDIAKEMTALKLNSKQKGMQNLETRLSNMEAMLACFQEDRMVAAAPAGNIEQRVIALEKSFESLKLQENRLLQLERKLDFKDSLIESLEAQLSGGEVISYDGTLLWRVTDFMRKRRDAITRRKTYILSPPFFSGTRGYKMCVRVYLNGDGQGKGTHISVFFTVLKGPFDALLPWPFKQVVQLSVLSQNGGINVRDSFRPDSLSASFQRPKKDANISSGCPMLLPLSSLDNGGYVEDDCLFIQARVEDFSL